jgi:acetyltransferase EpsM
MVVADIVRLAGLYEVAGFLDDRRPERDGTSFRGRRVFGGPGHLERLRAGGVTHALLAFGDCEARLQRARDLLDRGFALATAVHPRAVVAEDVEVGPGTVVAAGAVLNPGARLGANVIVNTGSCVDHECDIHDGAHLCPRTVLAGRVTVGRAAWVGVGAVVREGLTIGAGSVIGAGAVVLRDVPERVVAYGVPARVVRTTDAGAA